LVSIPFEQSRLPAWTVQTCVFIFLYFVQQKRTLRNSQREERPARSFSSGFRILEFSLSREIYTVMIPTIEALQATTSQAPSFC
jgi:hypothetical protein